MEALNSTITSRQELPDRLRGFSLLGIVLVNASYFAISSQGFTPASAQGWWNGLAVFLVYALAQGKFYLLFSFLFGYSSAFILRDGSRPHRRRFMRRLLTLIVFGLLHAVFLFNGDILVTYGIFGFGLLLLLGRSRWGHIFWSGFFFCVGVGWLGLILLESSAALGIYELPLDVALRDGTFLEAAQQRLRSLPETFLFVLLVQGPMAFAAFVVGALAARRHVLADPGARAGFWACCAIWGLALGLPLQLGSAWAQTRGLVQGQALGGLPLLGFWINLATAGLLTMGYVGLFAWAIARWPHFGSWLGPVGRMSLTVYLGESLILSVIFSAYGLGLFGTADASTAVLSGILTWLGWTAFSIFWMRRFSRGPLEHVAGLMTGKAVSNYV